MEKNLDYFLFGGEKEKKFHGKIKDFLNDFKKEQITQNQKMLQEFKFNLKEKFENIKKERNEYKINNKV